MKSYGQHYYIMAEFYLGFAGLFCGRFFFVICQGLRRFGGKGKEHSE